MLMHIKAHLARFPEHVAVQLDFQECFFAPSTVRRVWRWWFLSFLDPDLRGLRRPLTFSPALPTSSPQGMRTLSPPTMEYPRGDPLSTLLFATTMTTVVRQAVATVDVPS